MDFTSACVISCISSFSHSSCLGLVSYAVVLVKSEVATDVKTLHNCQDGG